ncbi:MAG: hypothetical protein RLZZ306_2922 [Bacteroidota bacterium]|jgi:hypothetical protein
MLRIYTDFSNNFIRENQHNSCYPWSNLASLIPVKPTLNPTEPHFLHGVSEETYLRVERL